MHCYDAKFLVLVPRKCRKLSKFLKMYEQLHLPKGVPIESVRKTTIRSLGVFCHTNQGGTRSRFFCMQRTHCIVTDHDARQVYDCEGFQATDDVPGFKNIQNLKNLFAFRADVEC